MFCYIFLTFLQIYDTGMTSHLHYNTSVELTLNIAEMYGG